MFKKILKFLKKNIDIEDLIIASLFIYLIYSLKEKNVENMTNLLKSGQIIRFLTTHKGKYIRGFNDGKVGWGGRGQEEKWIVKDAGAGKWAFFNPSHKRFLRSHKNGKMDLSDPKKDYNDLPPADKWAWERFSVHDAGDGKIALLGHFEKYTGITSNGVSYQKNYDDKYKKGTHIKDEKWMTWERFTITNGEEGKVDTDGTGLNIADIDGGLGITLTEEQPQEPPLLNNEPKNKVQEPAQEPVQEPAQEPVQEPAQEPAKPAQATPKKSSSKAPIFIILFLLLGVGAFIFIKKRRSKKN